MTDVCIGLLKVNKANFGIDATNRATEFSMAVQQANAILKSQQKGSGIRVLVAPEYYWSGYGQIGKIVKQHGPQPMSRDDKHDIYDALKSASSQAGSLVLVAGSIFYQKPSGNSTSAYNVCPVLSNGKFLLKSYKQMDDGAARKNPGSLTFDYKTSAPYFKYDGVRFGIEVCGEHYDHAKGSARLKDWVNINNKTIDIQILISDSTSINAPSVVATGYVVQCDIGGTAGGIGVYPAGGAYGTATALKPVSVSGTQINGASIYCYKVSV